MTKRYAEHAPYWQFVIWSRQFFLTLTTILPDTVTSMVDASSDSYVEAGHTWTLWIHAGAALVCFLVAAVAHYRVQPYRFGSESARVSTLPLWGFHRCSRDHLHVHARRTPRVWAEPLVETLIVGILIVPALVAVVYLLTYSYKRKRLEPV